MYFHFHIKAQIISRFVRFLCHMCVLQHKFWLNLHWTLNCVHFDIWKKTIIFWVQDDFFAPWASFRHLFWIFDFNKFSSKNIKIPKGVPRGCNNFSCRIRHILTQIFRNWTISYFFKSVMKCFRFLFLLIEQPILDFPQK